MSSLLLLDVSSCWDAGMAAALEVLAYALDDGTAEELSLCDRSAEEEEEEREEDVDVEGGIFAFKAFLD